MRALENPDKFRQAVQPYMVRCKCSHTFFIGKADRGLCSYCGNYVYKNKQTEFKYKLRKEMKKNDK